MAGAPRKTATYSAAASPRLSHQAVEYDRSEASPFWMSAIPSPDCAIESATCVTTSRIASTPNASGDNSLASTICTSS